jgi:hypothetical protein
MLGGNKMTMNNRKMNNYSLMRISAVFVLAVALVTSTLAIPFLPRTGAEPLTPPNKPSNPDPTDNSTGVSISAVLSWNCSDPDGDALTYDVYFGIKSPPSIVKNNISTTTYNPGTMNYSTKYYWQIVAWDNHSETSIGPQWEFTTEAGVNHPPNVPDNETPANASINIPVTTGLSWIGGDPDSGDTVTYDVYFGNTSTPPKVKNNQSTTNYNPSPIGDLENNTVYYWRIVAWDNNKAKTVGPLWHFKTGQVGPLTVTITKPIQGMFYFNDAEKMALSGNNTIVYGKITIEANVTSNAAIDRVEIYADGKPIANLTNVTGDTISYLWRPIIQFNSALSLKRTITVIAYDSEGNNATANITITKWRFHPLPWIIAGVAIASRFVLHTTVVGLFYNVQQSRFSVSFYALRAHYKTVGPLQMRKGNIHFKHCTGGILIGPTTLTKIGPFHRFAIGSFTFIGNVNADKIGLGGSLLSRILQRRSTGSNLLNQ